MELHNMEPELIDEIYKVTSINLCPNVPGQVAVGLMVNPPKPGEYVFSPLVVTASVTLSIISSLSSSSYHLYHYSTHLIVLLISLYPPLPAIHPKHHMNIHPRYHHLHHILILSNICY
jgi:hypothetical protein